MHRLLLVHTCVVPHIHLSYQWSPDGSDRTADTSTLQHPLMNLLQAVRSSGSIAMAAKALGLSYRHVWGELKRWEGVLGQDLIVWEKGQAARLTELANKLLWAERQAQARLAPQISTLQAELEKTFALAFDPDSQVLALYASHDDALVQLRERAASQRLHLDIRFCGSVDAIRALNEGRCTVAGFHAPIQPSADSLMARTLAPLMQTGRHKLISFAVRSQGLMVRPGNPLQLTRWDDLLRTGLRFVNRSLGTGTRLLLDDWLQSKGTAPEQVSGYTREESSHAAVAAAIAAGQADTGLGIEAAARAQGLDFVPLLTERYWLVCLRDALPTDPVQQLMALLSSEGWQTQLNTLAGYQVPTDTGQVQSLKASLPWW